MLPLNFKELFLFKIDIPARHKSNANYGNLVFDISSEKSAAMNLFYDSCLTIELGLKDFLTK